MVAKCWDWFCMGLFFGLGWALVNGLIWLLLSLLSHAKVG